MADAAKLVSEAKRFIGMVKCKEKNYCDSIFVNESFEEPKIDASASVCRFLLRTSQNTHF